MKYVFDEMYETCDLKQISFSPSSRGISGFVEFEKPDEAP